MAPHQLTSTFTQLYFTNDDGGDDDGDGDGDGDDDGGDGDDDGDGDQLHLDILTLSLVWFAVVQLKNDQT